MSAGTATVVVDCLATEPSWGLDHVPVSGGEDREATQWRQVQLAALGR